MIAILHGTWQPTTGRFFLWGEAATYSVRRGRQAAVPLHPFQLSTEALHERMVELPSSGRIPPEQTLTIWLPSIGKLPLPLREQRAAGAELPVGTPTLAPWRIHGLLMDAGQAIELLLALGNQHDVGSDLIVWRSAALLALEIVAGQQFMPTLTRDGARLRAAWQPRPTPVTQQKIAALARALPPLCRAVTENPNTAPPPRMLLDSFLATATDALVRDCAAADDPTVLQFANWRQPSAAPGGAWLAALLGPDPLLALQGRMANELYTAWQNWAEQQHVAGDESFRITFRLEPPTDAQAEWVLSYLLQATDDPSLLVPATQIWRERGQIFHYLDRRFEHPQERLLRGLGFAARLCPPIERSLRGKTPDKATLTVDEAFTFLKEAAALLDQSGFGVLLPSWWHAAGQLKARARASVRKKKGKGSDSEGRLSFASMISFRWEMSIGEQLIDRAEFERLVALKQPLVQVRGQWIALDPAQMQRAVTLFRHETEMTLTEALRIGLGGVDPALPSGVAYAGIEAEGALGDLLHGLAGSQSLAQLPQPPELVGQLRPYQQRGFEWLAFMDRVGMGACLADDMGLGKTVVTIALLLYQKAHATADGAALLVCPTSVVGNWQRELARFAPTLRVYVHQGAERLRGEALTAATSAHDIVLTSYPLLTRDTETFKQIEWRIAVLDEAQNIKNNETQQAQAARVLQAQFRVALTGTPVENRLTELWSIMTFLNPGYLGGETEFRRNFARPIERANDAEAAERLRRLTTPFVLRRLKTDRTIINDLPDKIEMKVYVPLTQEQATLYEATVRDALAHIDEADSSANTTKRRGLVLAMLSKLKQICNHPTNFLKDGSPLTGRSGKLTRLTEMLEEVLAADDRALIFTQFAEMGTLLQTHLTERLYTEVLFLHGGTPAKQRDGMVRHFQAPDGPRIFILSLKAGGVGLNLTRGNHVFHFDRWWNPAVEDQATDRAFRIGQIQQVQVHKFICGGTLEEQIDTMIESKRALASQVLGTGEAWLTELSTDQLREMVMLRNAALSE